MLRSCFAWCATRTRCLVRSNCSMGARVTREADEGPVFVRALVATAAAPHVTARAGDGASRELIFSFVLHGISSLQPCLCAQQSISRARRQRASKCSSSAAGSGSANWLRSKWRDPCTIDTSDGSNPRFTIISTFNTCAVLVVCSMTVLGAVTEPSTC